MRKQQKHCIWPRSELGAQRITHFLPGTSVGGGRWLLYPGQSGEQVGITESLPSPRTPWGPKVSQDSRLRLGDLCQKNTLHENKVIWLHVEGQLHL